MDVEADEVLYDSQTRQLRTTAQILRAHFFLARSRQPALYVIAFDVRQLPEYIPIQSTGVVLLSHVIVPSLVFHLIMLFVSPLLYPVA